jgi:hypothetical protein
MELGMIGCAIAATRARRSAPDPHSQIGRSLRALARELGPIRLLTLRRSLGRSDRREPCDLVAADLALVTDLLGATPDWVSATELRREATLPVLGFALTLHHPDGALVQIELELGAESPRFELTGRSARHRLAFAQRASERPTFSLDGEPQEPRGAAAPRAGAARRPGARLARARVLEALRLSAERGGCAIELGPAPEKGAGLARP